MLKVIVQSSAAEGKSTVAALVAKALAGAGIPHAVVDGYREPGDAESLAADPDRLARNVASVSGRLELSKTAVAVQTQCLASVPVANIPGDHAKFVFKVVREIWTGTYASATVKMREAFDAYGVGLADTIKAAVRGLVVTPTEVIALAALYEAVRKGRPDADKFATLEP